MRVSAFHFIFFTAEMRLRSLVHAFRFFFFFIPETHLRAIVYFMFIPQKRTICAFRLDAIRDLVPLYDSHRAKPSAKDEALLFLANIHNVLWPA